MNLKNIVLVLSVCINLVLAIIVYDLRTKEYPLDIGFSFKEAVRVENYGLAKTLLAEGRKEHISEETLKKVNEIMSGGTSFKTYQLIEFDNGEMVLLNLTPIDKYEIQDIVIVPQRLKFIFK